MLSAICKRKGERNKRLYQGEISRDNKEHIRIFIRFKVTMPRAVPWRHVRLPARTSGRP